MAWDPSWRKILSKDLEIRGPGIPILTSFLPWTKPASEPLTGTTPLPSLCYKGTSRCDTPDHVPAIRPISQLGSSWAQVIIVPTVSFTTATISRSNSYKGNSSAVSRMVRPNRLREGTSALCVGAGAEVRVTGLGKGWPSSGPGRKGKVRHEPQPHSLRFSS